MYIIEFNLFVLQSTLLVGIELPSVVFQNVSGLHEDCLSVVDSLKALGDPVIDLELVLRTRIYVLKMCHK